MFNNKRGQELSTNTIILIILGALVLVVLILASTGVFGDLSKWISPSNNVKDVVDSCASQCTMQNAYDFCVANKTLNTEGADYLGSCYTFSLLSEFEIFGIEGCGAINCEDRVSCDTWIYEKDGNVLKSDLVGKEYCKTD